MGHLVRLSYPDALSGSFALASHAVPATPGTAYSDWECTIVDPVRVLSAAGRRTFYVKTATDVVVYDADGVTVDTFTEGVRAELVGVNALTLTGTLPDGSQGVGGDLSLAEYITTLRASFGANNGKVRETGQATDLLLKDALRGIRSANLPYFNVKSSPYNAVGDGVALDTAAIQAAINAAATAGGGVVYFPIGDYLCPTGLSITNNSVSLVGDGAASRIRFTGAAGFAVTVVGSGAAAQNSITRMRISATSLGSLIDITSNSSFRIDGNTLDAVNGNGAIRFANSPPSVTNNIMTGNVSASRGLIEGSGIINGTFVANNVISTSFTAGGALVRLSSASSVDRATVVGNTIISGAALAVTFSGAAGGFYTAVGNSGAPSTGGVIVEAGAEAGSYYDVGSGGIQLNGTGITGGVISTTRSDRSVTAATGTTLTPVSGAEDNVIDVNATPLTANAPSPAVAWDGAKLYLRIRNTTGAPLVINWNAAYLGSAAMGNLAAGATRVVLFIRKETGTTPGWRYAIHADTV